MTSHTEQNKELLEYISLRIRSLEFNKRPVALKKLVPKKREMVRRQITGRIYELRYLHSIIAQHKEFEQINIMKGELIEKLKKGKGNPREGDGFE